MGIENENGLTVKDSTISPNLTEKNIESYIFERRISFRVVAIFKIASDSFTEQSDKRRLSSAEEYSRLCGVSAMISESADTCSVSTIRVKISRERFVFPFSMSLKYGVETLISSANLI